MKTYLSKINSSLASLAMLAACAGAATSLVACEQGAMYCLAAGGDYAAKFTVTSGPPECIGPDVQKMLGDYYLGVKGQDPPVPDPSTPSIALTLGDARGARDKTIEHIKALRAYDNCPSKAADFVLPPIDESFKDQPFYAYSLFTSGDPDQNDNCFASQFSEGAIDTPELPAVPACAEQAGSKALELLPASSIKYTISDVSVKVKPAIQGQLIRGKVTVTKPDCSASYDFVALNPAVKCVNDAECRDQNVNPKAVKVNGDLRNDVICGIPAGAAEGLCVYNGPL